MLGRECPVCGKPPVGSLGGRCIDCLIAAVPWKAGDNVSVQGKVGTVRYVYYNGFTLVEFPDEPIVGGILNNSSTCRNEEVKEV